MGLLNTIKGWWNKMFRTAVKREYNVTGIESDSMKNSIKTWMDIYQGNPAWLNPVEEIGTLGFAKFICSEVARLVTLDIDVAFDGSRKEYMQRFWDKSVKPRLREWVEYGASVGTIILKPNGEGVDFVTPDRFEVISKDGNGNITGVVFQDGYVDNEKYYTKLEYHRFWTADVRMNPDQTEYTRTTFYTITNRAFESNSSTSIGTQIPLSQTKWSNLKDEVNITKQNDERLDSMLFGVFKIPSANDIDMDSPLGVSVFANALAELRDLDVAYSRNATEIYDSRKIVLLDDRLIQLPSTKDANGNIVRHKQHMPKYVRNVNADDENSFYQEIVPTLNTSVRKEGIDFYLSLIGCKCGFSNGYFVLDQKTGMITATQVEADDRNTIQLIKDIRDALSKCLDDVFYAQSVFADLYELAPVGEYETNYNFGDITYNYDEDKKTWYSYVTAGKIPFWFYLTKFEGMSEDEAKALASEMEQPEEDNLFKAE